jgi:NitT/TauT family transport system substrate-binding protein
MGEVAIPKAVARRCGLNRPISGVLSAGLMLLMACGAPAERPAAASATPPPTLKLRIGMNTTPIPALTSSILWLAKDLGYYLREGLDVDIVEFTGAPVGITALQTGDVDVGNLGPLDAIRLNASQLMSLRAIGASGSDDFSLIVAHDTIGSFAELKGKSYAVSRPGGADDTTARRVLAASGMSESDVNFVAVGAPNIRAQALLGGQIDATTVQISTWITLRDKPGLKLLATIDQIRAVVPNSATLNVVTARTLNAEPEQLRRFTAAIMKTARLFQSSKQAWVEAMSVRRPDLARSDLEFLWDQFTTSWGVNGFLNLPQLQKESDFAYQTTPDLAQLPRIGTADWIETRFVDAVLKEIGIYPEFDDPGRAIN